MIKKIGTAVRKVGDQLRKILPKFLLGHEKAVAGFLAPIVVMQVSRIEPSWHLSPNIAAQLILAAISALTVHTATNTGPAAG